MKLLVNRYDLDVRCPNKKEDVSRVLLIELFDRINSNFTDYYPHYSLCRSEQVFPSVTFGSIDPQSVIHEAKEWNLRIQKNLLDAMQNLLAKMAFVPNPEEIPIDDGNFEVERTDITHSLSCAARMADDIFNPFGDYGILIDDGYGYPHFGTIINKTLLEDIRQRPEDYVICEITVED